MFDEDSYPIVPGAKDRGREIDYPDGLRRIRFGEALGRDVVGRVEGIRIEAHAVRVARRDGAMVSPGRLALAHDRAMYGKRAEQQDSARRSDLVDDPAASHLLPADHGLCWRAPDGD